MPSLQQQFIEAKRAALEALYPSLNPPQRQVVFHANGPLLVLAGAGSGKTTVLVQRIAHLMQFGAAYESDFCPPTVTEADVRALRDLPNQPREVAVQALKHYAVAPCLPWQILSITFTNKAANEMKERLKRTVGDEAAEIWAGTFHSICVRILRRFGEKIGYRPGFTIYDTDDSKKQILSCLKELNIDDKMLPVKTVMNAISRAKDSLLTADRYRAQLVGGDFIAQKIADVYDSYEKHLKQSNALDFDDLILQTVELLRNHGDVRLYYQNHFRYVCVDEYQDTSRAQSELIRLFADAHQNLMVVGDDDQSIYKFRGATIENILDFDQTFEKTRVIKLEQNYRSTAVILNAANAVIANNRGRRGKELWTKNKTGERITVRRLGNQNDEARFIATRILGEITQSDRTYRDYAVLYRTNAQSNVLEQVLSKSGIPYRMLGGTRFYERKEIKDMLAYLCLIENPNDNLRLKRIINEPKRKIGEQTVHAIEVMAQSEGTSMMDILSRVDDYVALKRSAATLRAFYEMMSDWHERKNQMTVSALVAEVFSETGYCAMLEAAGILEVDRIQNVKELISNAVVYENEQPEPTLAGFLEDVALVSDIDNYDEDADAVVMMTIHSAKGLEFPVVFLPGLEEGLFPSRQSEMSDADLEEERRLAYVAITRAKEKLYCLHTAERLLYGQTQYNPPSRFLEEIPEGCVDREQPTSYTKNGTRSYAQGKPSFTTPIRELDRKPFSADTTTKKSAPKERFSVGTSVKHPSFGVGIVLSCRPMGADCLYEIAFDSVGTKKLMGNYASLTKA